MRLGVQSTTGFLISTPLEAGSREQVRLARCRPETRKVLRPAIRCPSSLPKARNELTAPLIARPVGMALELPPELLVSIQRVLELKEDADAEAIDSLGPNFSPVDVLNKFFPNGARYPSTSVQSVNSLCRSITRESRGCAKVPRR